jgi:hypothetical protein
MAHPTGESKDGVLKLDFDRRPDAAVSWVRGHVRCGIVGVPRTRRRTRVERDSGRDPR